MKPKKPSPQKPTIRKVKIDEHIKSAKGNDQQSTPRKRGRPAGSGKKLQSEPSFINPSHSDSPTLESTDNVGTDFAQHGTPEIIEPGYDTTPEAKAFLAAPFEAAAGLTGIAKLKLYPEQLEAAVPSFKLVYDKHILPHMGENPELIAFAVVMLGITFEKVSVFKEEQAKRQPKKSEQATDSAGMPYIPTEHHV